MTKRLVHIGKVAEGSIVSFPHSVYAYMKVCDKNGIGGVVRLFDGKYIAVRNLTTEGLGVMVSVDYDTLDKMYADKPNEDDNENEYYLEMKASLGNNWW